MLTILFADNDPDFLKTRCEYLEREGYRVLPALNPAQAKEILGRGGINLVIVDIRLENDDDEKDVSGLTLAKDPTYQTIPKIILTGFPSVNAVRESLKLQKSGVPAAIDFVSKGDGAEALVASINRSVAVHIEKRPLQVLLNVSELLEKGYEEARKQAVFTHRMRLFLIVIGSFTILGGSVSVVLGYTSVGVLSAISGLVVEALAVLFSKLSVDANKRMDTCRKELLELYRKQK